MKSIFANVLLFLAITVTGIAIDPVSAAVTATMTEPLCINGCAGEATPLSVAEVLATVTDSINNVDTNGSQATVDKRWSKGRNSLCFTSSSLVMAGYYAIYLDGWGQEHDGCGREPLTIFAASATGLVLDLSELGIWRAADVLPLGPS
ncbi:hypothetical protein F5883DRAFT_665976 [Diaporthe sp. PMI_573]|nr:hypothetical protein F5883DRAFT_665976 [Diaporthaceae sp. PMI_573]